MVRLVSGVSDRLCPSCPGGITKMEKLPHLNEVYMCPLCSGTQCCIPGEEVIATTTEQEQKVEND